MNTALDVIAMLVTYAGGAIFGHLWGGDIIRMFSKRRRLMVELDKKRPGWREIVTSRDFESWLWDQPPEVQAKVNSFKLQDAIDAIDLFYTRPPK